MFSIEIKTTIAIDAWSAWQIESFLYRMNVQRFNTSDSFITVDGFSINKDLVSWYREINPDLLEAYAYSQFFYLKHKYDNRIVERIKDIYPHVDYVEEILYSKPLSYAAAVLSNKDENFDGEMLYLPFQIFLSDEEWLSYING